MHLYNFSGETEVVEAQKTAIREQRIRGMSSMTSDGGEGTEGEQESLPHDQNMIEIQSRNESARKLWHRAMRLE